MTTADWADIWLNYPSDLRVMANGYENVYDNLSPKQLSVVRIASNIGQHPWEGRQGDPNGRTVVGPDSADVIEALVLRRVSN